MQKWNINFNRILKVASCSVVIFTILLASVVTPAFAAASGLPLSNFVQSVEYDDNGDKIVTYQFNYTPQHTVFYGGVVYFDGRKESYTLDSTSLPGVSWHIWPLGVKGDIGKNFSDIVNPNLGVIDIRDLQSYSTLRLGVNSAVHFEYTHISEAVGPAPLQIDLTAILIYWDENGNYVGFTTKSSKGTYTLPELPDGEVNQGHIVHLNGNYDTGLIRNAAFMMPYYQIKITFPDQEYGVSVTKMNVDPDRFTLYSNVNYLEENSETLKVVSEKLDTLINGTDDQRDHAQDVYDVVQNESDILDDQLGQLEELEDFDTSTVFGTINEFLEADGWKDIRMLLAPLLDWTHAATLMLFVFAFSTLRILLLGR